MGRHTKFPGYCNWQRDEDDTEWDVECGGKFTIMGMPEHFVCPFCKRKIATLISRNDGTTMQSCGIGPI